MKKLRISSDYVAVDVVNEKDEIIDTPIYLTINKPKQLLWFDIEEKIWMQTTATYTKNGIECRDSDGLVWVSVIEELLTQARPVHHAVKPGDSD